VGGRQKHGFLRELGVDEALDRGEPISVRDVDVVLDAVGGDVGLGALPALRNGGVLVTVSGSSVPGLVDAARGRVRVAGILVEPDRVGMEALAGLALRPHVERTFPLEQAAAAHELGEQGRTRGKLVLRV
jgi:NADPH:quinone reductase-like Zn-dependent oxidoreductase